MLNSVELLSPKKYHPTRPVELIDVINVDKLLKNQRFRGADYAKWQSMIDDDYLVQEIADLYECNYSTVYRKIVLKDLSETLTFSTLRKLVEEGKEIKPAVIYRNGKPAFKVEPIGG